MIYDRGQRAPTGAHRVSQGSQGITWDHWWGHIMNTGTPEHVNYPLYHDMWAYIEKILWPILSDHKSGHKIGQGPWNFNTWVQDRLTPMYQNFMDLVHELCPAQLLEVKVTKKSDNLSAWLTSIQHLAHIELCNEKLYVNVVSCQQ